MAKLKDSILKSTQEKYSNVDVATYAVLCAIYEKSEYRPLHVDVTEMARILFHTNSPTSSNKNIVRKSLAKLGMPNEVINYDLFVDINNRSDYYTEVYVEDLSKVLSEGSSKFRFALLRTYLGILSTFNSKHAKKIGYMSIAGMSQIFNISSVTLNKHIKCLQNSKVLYCRRRHGFNTSNVYSRWADRKLADEYVETHESKSKHADMYEEEYEEKTGTAVDSMSDLF